MNNRRKLAAKIGVAVALMATSMFAFQPAAQGDVRVRASTLTAGVTYSAYTIAGPNRVKLVTVDADASNAEIDVALAKSTLPGWSRPSTMGTQHDALVAVNGDFGFSPGRPAHLFAEDGQMVTTSKLGNDGKNFAISSDEQDQYVGQPGTEITVMQVASRRTFTAEHFNEGQPKATEISAFSPAGGSLERPGNGCSARLMPSTGPGWSGGQMGVQRDFTVDTVACGGSLAVNGGIVLVAQSGTSRADQIRGLVRGETVRLTWSLGWRGVLDSIGGSPVLLENGKVIVSACSAYLCQRHPRTAVGFKSNGDVLIMQVDGRTSASIGLTLVGLANEFKRKGAIYALNLDGGGSSSMWIRGKGVVSSPSDGSERSVSSALLVLGGPDSGDPNNMAPRAPVSDADASAAEAVAADDFAAAVADPASTGGLLDYELTQRSRTRAPLELDPELQGMLDSFYAAQG